MYYAELTTKDGRKFRLAPFGWSFARDNDSRVNKYPTRREAYGAARRAWKAKGDKVKSTPEEI